jgi:hypothetical protein
MKGSRKWEVGNGKWEVGNRKWEGSDFRLPTSDFESSFRLDFPRAAHFGFYTRTSAVVDVAGA